MGRSYHLSKELAEGQAARILAEINALPDIKQASFSNSMDYLFVETTDHEYSAVMSRAVNIFSQTGNGCELSFSCFIPMS